MGIAFAVILVWQQEAIDRGRQELLRGRPYSAFELLLDATTFGEDARLRKLLIETQERLADDAGRTGRA